MTSLRAPNSLTRLPSQTALPRLCGLFNSSRSIFSPSLTAQTACAVCAVALAFRKKNARQMTIIRFKLFSSNIYFDFGNDTADCAVRTRRVGFQALPQRRKQSQQLYEQRIHGRAVRIRHAKIKAVREKTRLHLHFLSFSNIFAPQSKEKQELN